MRSEILSIVAIIGLLPCASRAQEAGGSVACPSIENDQQRLACYDHAMRAAPHSPASAATPAPNVQTPPPAAAPAAAAAVGAAAATPPPASVTVAPAAPAAVAPAAPVTAAPASAAPVAAAPTTGGSVGAAAATTAAAGAASSAAATPQSTVSTAPHNARDKHGSSPPAPDAPPTIDPTTGQPTGIMPIVVLSTLVRPGFPTEFTTDKAGVWTQTEIKPLPALPKAPFNAQLEPGKFGSAFLVVPDRKLGVRVHAPDR
jgi:hypothetical protein